MGLIDKRGDIMSMIVKCCLFIVLLMITLVVSVVFEGCSDVAEPHSVSVKSNSGDCNCSIDLVIQPHGGGDFIKLSPK